MKVKKFWNFTRNEDGERILRLEGPIDEDSFWGDEVTPSAFREELEAEEGDVTVWVNSPGGNVFAAAEIYTMLRDHKGKVTVKIDAIAASAASVVAMAGDSVLMSPVAMLMIHDPMTIAMGNTKDMEKAITVLNEVKESIINAYVSKTGLSRKKVAQLMSDETWLNAKKAVELGFADGLLFAEGKEEADEKEVEALWQPYSTRSMGQAILNRLVCAAQAEAGEGGGAEKAGGPDAPEAEGAVESPPAGVTNPKEQEESAEEKAISPESDQKEPVPINSETTGAGSANPPASDAVSTDTPPNTATDSIEPVTPAADTPIVLGMDGRTKDGAMPYQLLKERLEWLR